MSSLELQFLPTHNRIQGYRAEGTCFQDEEASTPAVRSPVSMLSLGTNGDSFGNPASLPRAQLHMTKQIQTCTARVFK